MTDKPKKIAADQEEKRETQYVAVHDPRSHQGVGWVLSRAYPAAGDNMPPDILHLLQQLDRVGMER